MALLGIDSNAKTVKGQKKGYMTAILYLAPSDESGVINVCPFASAGCRAACLYTAGHGRFEKVRNSRIEKTKQYASNKAGFILQLEKEIKAFIKKAENKNLIPVIRLNGTSDISWEKSGLMEKFPNVQFYDYTAIPKKAIRWANGELPPNYHITFSRKETKENHAACEEVAKHQGNIAVVFQDSNFPKEYLGLPVINGDENDLRFLDPKGCVVGLKAKGDAKKDTTGFVVRY